MVTVSVTALIESQEMVTVAEVMIKKVRLSPLIYYINYYITDRLLCNILDNTCSSLRLLSCDMRCR